MAQRPTIAIAAIKYFIIVLLSDTTIIAHFFDSFANLLHLNLTPPPYPCYNEYYEPKVQADTVPTGLLRVSSRVGGSDNRRRPSRCYHVQGIQAHQHRRRRLHAISTYPRHLRNHPLHKQATTQAAKMKALISLMYPFLAVSAVYSVATADGYSLLQRGAFIVVLLACVAFHYRDQLR